MKVFIQQINKEFADDWLYAAYLGFSKLGMEIIFFEDIMEVPKNKDNIVVGFIEDTVKHFNKWSIYLAVLNIHSSIIKYCKRNIEFTTMGNFRKNPKLPIFIKPYSKIKQFDTGVITKLSSLDFFNNIHDNEQIVLSEVVNMLSEYRCFVYNNELVGIQWYSGDFTLFPDISIIKEAIKDFSKPDKIVPTTQDMKPPIAYTMDFAITPNRISSLFSNETVLIECNDMWSVGNYGIESKIYAKMLRDRWIEIFKNYK